jgi:hypothetical protein
VRIVDRLAASKTSGRTRSALELFLGCNGFERYAAIGQAHEALCTPAELPRMPPAVRRITED